jgi:hypothetical protein
VLVYDNAFNAGTYDTPGSTGILLANGSSSVLLDANTFVKFAANFGQSTGNGVMSDADNVVGTALLRAN